MSDIQRQPSMRELTALLHAIPTGLEAVLAAGLHTTVELVDVQGAEVQLSYPHRRLIRLCRGKGLVYCGPPEDAPAVAGTLAGRHRLARAGSAHALGELRLYDPAAGVDCASQELMLQLCARMLVTAIEQTLSRTWLIREAQLDGVTGLPNHTYLTAILDLRLTHPAPDNQAGLLALDLSGFKQVNESLGHPAGNEILRIVAKRLNVTAQVHHGMAARLGGDEFTILIPDPGQVQICAIRAVEAIRRPIPVDGTFVRISAIVGTAVATGHTISAAELIKQADTALSTGNRPPAQRQHDDGRRVASGAGQ